MLDDAEDFETQQVFQDFQTGEADPSAPSWTVLWPNEDNSVVVDHVTADDPFLALEAASNEHNGDEIDPETAVVISGQHFDALCDFDPTPNKCLAPLLGSCWAPPPPTSYPPAMILACAIAVPSDKPVVFNESLRQIPKMGICVQTAEAISKPLSPASRTGPAGLESGFAKCGGEASPEMVAWSSWLVPPFIH